MECLFNFFRQISLLAIFLNKLVVMESVLDKFRDLKWQNYSLFISLLTDYVVAGQLDLYCCYCLKVCQVLEFQ